MAVVVAGSLVAGFLAAVALVAAPVVPATESALTGAVLCGFAIGWAAPGRALDAVHRAATALGRGARPGAGRRAASPCWPSGPRRTPPSTGSGRRSCSDSQSGWPCRSIATSASRAARWLLYPAIGAMGLAAVGGAYQTVGTAADASASRCRAGWSTSAGTACT